MLRSSDNIILNVDLSQAELRCMAIFSEDPWMIAALQEGEGDFFDSHLMPVAFPHRLDEYGSIEEFKIQAPKDHKEDRTKVKGIQYGLAFGRSAPAIARALGMTRREAQAIIDNYFETAPLFNQWREDVMQAAIDPAKRDLLINPFGRRFQSEVVSGRNYRKVQREALSFLPQSTSSDIALLGAMRTHAVLKEDAPEYTIINVVHDAIMIEGPRSSATEIGNLVMRELRAVGSAAMGDSVPFLSEASIGLTWGELD